jgi:ATP-dependent Lhr-like helicase
VRLATRSNAASPTWRGGRLPLSNELGREVEALFEHGDASPEWQALAPLFALQRKLSALPGPQHLLIERLSTRRGHHLAIYPFAGRLIHEGLAAVLSTRLARLQPNSIGYAANDYGLMLTAVNAVASETLDWKTLLSPARLQDDLGDAMNLAELARRQFREIARIAGLLPPSLPGRAPRSLRQLQASSRLIYDVLQRYDPDHLLLAQARREVLSGQLHYDALQGTLADCAARRPLLREPASLTPLAFPLWAESFRGQLSTEDWQTRIARVASALERRHA